MKKSFYLLLGILLSGCFADNAKVVETEKQTNNCIVGVWMPENTEGNVNTLEFQAPTVNEGKSGTVIFSDEFQEPNGNTRA